jgi:hypothetical protein
MHGIESHPALVHLFEHDLFGKPGPIFPDHVGEMVAASRIVRTETT